MTETRPDTPTPSSPVEAPSGILAPGVAFGGASGAWQRLADRPLLVIVGVTAVGKSTVLRALIQAGLRCATLPGRRVQTDRLIVAPLRAADGQPPEVLGRFDRYPYVRRHLQRSPGGMADILAGLSVDASTARSLLLFESLRGAHEVRAAAAALPLAHFLLLQAPDGVRLQRLLARDDPHDRLNAGPRLEADSALWPGPPGAAGTAAGDSRRDLSAGWPDMAPLPRHLREKLQILQDERVLYDPDATRAALQAVAPERTLIVDTTEMAPERVAGLAIARFALPVVEKERRAHG